MKLAATIFGILLLIPMITLFIDYQFIRGPIFCKLVGWHWDKWVQTNSFDGYSLHGTCSRCGKKVMKDSNGDWF